jgi:hypothetical protein
MKATLGSNSATGKRILASAITILERGGGCLSPVNVGQRMQMPGKLKRAIIVLQQQISMRPLTTFPVAMSGS